MYIATVALCACGGCHNSLMAAGEPFVSLLSEHTISFSSYLFDRRTISPSDVVLATGGIRNHEELEIAREIERTSRKVIAVGSCAVYGGLPGARDREEPPVVSEGAGLPEMLENVMPLDSIVGVELYVPGCPPPPGLILESLKSLEGRYEPPHFDGTVCSECPRSIEVKPVKSWSLHPGCGVPEGSCLLNHGLLCLGPVTRGGCLAACPLEGSICIGCRGPSDMVLSSQLHSMYSDMVKYVTLSTASRREKVEKKLSAVLETIYLFTRRDPVIRAKVKEKVPGE